MVEGFQTSIGSLDLRILDRSHPSVTVKEPRDPASWD